MSTQKIHKKIVEASLELYKLGLNGWQTELVMKDDKKKTETEVKVIFKLKTKKIK